MSQTTYSNDEIKLLLRTLYDEKKKNKELLSKLTPSQENDELTQENKALQQQVAFLKKQIEKIKGDSVKHDPRQLELFHETLERQNALERDLRDKLEEIATLKNNTRPQVDNEQISQMQDLVALLQEQLAKSEKSNREHAETFTKVQQYQHQIESHRHEISRLQNAIFKEREQKEQFQRQITGFQADTSRAEELQADLTKGRSRIDLLENELVLERNLKRDLDEELTRAQHHLAKKVKEVALLEQAADEINQAYMTAQKVITENQMRLNELESANEAQRQQEIRLQDQLREASKAAETQLAKSEEKQIQLTQKLQILENRLKELEKVEEKQKRLQTFLTEINLVNPLVESDPGIDLTAALPTKEKENQYNNLFEMPKKAQKNRRSLFE